MTVDDISNLDEYYSCCQKIIGKEGKDFSKLKLHNNKLMIKSIWNYILDTSKSYDDKLIWSNLNNNEHLLKIILSMDPYIQAGYDPRCNNIKYNFYGFFFNYNPWKYQVIFYPPVLQIGRLVHEFDHYLYCKSNNLIHTEQKIDKAETELRALESEIRFLQDVKEKHHEKKYWEVINGKFKLRLYDVNRLICDRIYVCNNGIKSLKNNNEYDECCAKKLDFCYINKIMSFLNADKFDENKTDYECIHFPFID